MTESFRRVVFGILAGILLLGFMGGGGRAQTPESSPATPLSHAVFTELLKKFVDKKGLVDYRSFKRDKDSLATLDAYAEDMMKIDGTALEPAGERMAYWLNLYHALVLREILKNYPIQTTAQIPHFFDGPRYLLAAFPGEKLSLMDIEQKIFRERFNDPRLHLVRMNGSLSGPSLLQTAFEAKGFEKQLEEATMSFLKDTSKNSYDSRKNIFYGSPLFNWFEEDFEKYLMSSRSFIASRIPLPLNFRLQFMGYDWKLNDSKYR
jgi:uncharacterized protein DUF547